MITCFDPTGASPPSIGGLLLCPRLGAVGIGGRAGEDTGPYGGAFYRGFPGDGHGAPGLPRPAGGHRTWFVKTGVGSHIVRPSFPGAVGVGRAGGHRPPLHTVYRQARRRLRHRASATIFKFRRQVAARRAERQRRFIARLKTGRYSQDTFCFARATAAAFEAAH